MMIVPTPHHTVRSADDRRTNVIALRPATWAASGRVSRLVHADRRNFRKVVWLLTVGSVLAVLALALSSSWNHSGLALAVGLAFVACAVVLDSGDRRHARR